MSIGTIISLMRGAVTQVISMVAPVLGLALLVGLIVAIFQATTSIQEQTLTSSADCNSSCYCTSWWNNVYFSW